MKTGMKYVFINFYLWNKWKYSVTRSFTSLSLFSVKCGTLLLTVISSDVIYWPIHFRGVVMKLFISLYGQTLQILPVKNIVINNKYVSHQEEKDEGFQRFQKINQVSRPDPTFILDLLHLYDIQRYNELFRLAFSTSIVFKTRALSLADEISEAEKSSEAISNIAQKVPDDSSLFIKPKRHQRRLFPFRKCPRFAGQSWKINVYNLSGKS